MKGNESSMNSHEPLIEVASAERNYLPINQQEPRRRNSKIDREVQGGAAVVLYAPLHATVDHGKDCIAPSEGDRLSVFEKLLDGKQADTAEIDELGKKLLAEN